jgi:hypothetical protein
VIDDPTSGDCTDSRDSAAADAADAVTALLLRDTSEEPTDLRLADLSICELPEGFGVKNKQSSTHSLLHRFASAITLDLALNQLRALPAGFGTSLASLKVLHLGGPGPTLTNAADASPDPDYWKRNRLTLLADEVVLALAPTLEDLSLHDNELRELPALDCCSRLQHLRLDRNPLTAHSLLSH